MKRIALKKKKKVKNNEIESDKNIENGVEEVGYLNLGPNYIIDKNASISYPFSGLGGSASISSVSLENIPNILQNKFVPKLGALNKISSSYILGGPYYDSENIKSFQNETNKLRDETLELIDKLRKKENELLIEKKDRKNIELNKKEIEKDYRELEKTIKEYEKQIALGNLIDQVNDKAKQKLLENEQFRELFEIEECNSYVVSIDIRRSTELMLKAKQPKHFQDYIVSLCDGLSKIIVDNFGVFDKFTGDGILAFFPDFFCGKDAGLMAIKSCIECHNYFKYHYESKRNCFVSVMARCWSRNWIRLWKNSFSKNER